MTENLSLQKLTATYSNDLYTAVEIGEEPIHCDICGKERLWRKLSVFGKETHVCMQCKCEKEEKEKDDQRLQEYNAKVAFESRVEQATIPLRLKNASFDNYKILPQNQKAFIEFKKYADEFTKETEIGLCVYGNAGNGKSHLSAALANDLLNKGYSIKFQNVPDLFSRIKATFDNSSNETEFQIIKELTNVDLLILDDAGAEKPTEWVQEKLYQIINNRYNNLKPIVISTNTEKMVQLNEILGFRAYDRLTEMCKPIKNDGTSYRRFIATERLKNESI